MATTYNLKEIANKFAKKQAAEMVDDLTEETPILERCRWEPASHNLWNMGEKVSDITGAGWTDADEALSNMNVSSTLIKTDLTVLGGEMEQAEDTVDQFGGAAAYFAKKEPLILKQAGMDTEAKLYYDNWFAKALADGNAVNAGSTAATTYSIVIVRMAAGENAGLFDPTGFVQGSLLKRALINNGARYHLRSKTGVLGYGVTLKGRFGWQNLSTKSVGVIANIDASNLPTAIEIDNLLSDVRARPETTMILMHPKCKALAINGFKASSVQAGITTIAGVTEALTASALQMNVMDTKYNRIIDYWNNIPIITSYNIKDGTEAYTTTI